MKNSLGIIAVYGVRHLLTGVDNDKDLAIYIVYDRNGSGIIGYYFSIGEALNVLENALNDYLIRQLDNIFNDEKGKCLIDESNRKLMDNLKAGLSRNSNNNLINELKETLCKYFFQSNKLIPEQKKPFTINDAEEKIIVGYINDITKKNLTSKFKRR
ncbi:hypothetical protein ACIPSR_00020 [Pectobacterium sp. CHL-2024]|uniref:hypothetical protein n=1 Tax=Pectobacterium sp. CHL-2024 TaxID=3377079 RepID=UPI00382C0AC3